MAKCAFSLLLAAGVLAGLGDPAAAQMTQKQYEAFIRAEISKCVAESVRLDKEAGILNHPTAPKQEERVASCREMLLQVHDLYPFPETKGKGR